VPREVLWANKTHYVIMSVAGDSGSWHSLAFAFSEQHFSALPPKGATLSLFTYG